MSPPAFSRSRLCLLALQRGRELNVRQGRSYGDGGVPSRAEQLVTAFLDRTAAYVHYQETNVHRVHAQGPPAREAADREGGDCPTLEDWSGGLSAAEEECRHGRWQHNRSLLLNLLVAEHMPPGRIRRVLACGSGLHIYRRADTGALSLRGQSCRDRFCTPCSAAASWRVAQNLERLCSGSPTRLLTLTLKHSSAPVRDQIRRGVAAFRAIRRRKEWKERVTGGAWFCEVKVSEATEEWHVHYHVLLKGDYIPHQTLRAWWLEETGDSHVIRLELAREGLKGSHYAAKYATKGFEDGLWARPSAVAVLLNALRRVRLYGAFGTWREGRLSVRAGGGPGWVPVERLNAAVEQARRGDLGSLALLRALPADLGRRSLGISQDAWLQLIRRSGLAGAAPARA